MDKTIGLINKPTASGICFKTRFGIHTFFMTHKIDILILDSRNKVIKLVHGLKPFSLYFYSPKFNQVIELPDGSLKQSHTQVGDMIKILN